MTKVFWLVSLLAVTAGVSAGQATEQLVTIQGKVIDSTTKQPLEGARAILQRTSEGPVVLSASIRKTELSPAEPDPAAEKLAVLTGSDGSFRFRVKAPVKFRLYVEHKGYVSTPTGSAALAYEGAPGVKSEDIVVGLLPEAAISGRVIDAESQQPAPGLMVTPYSYFISDRDGARIFRPAGASDTTDEAGRYHLKGIPPGEYYLKVQPPLGARIGDPTPVEDFPSAVRMGHGPSWYPGVELFNQAATVMVVGGNAPRDIDFLIEKRKLFALRGAVVGDGASGEVELYLEEIQRGIGSIQVAMIARGKRSVDSVFEINNLSPGTYSLYGYTSGEPSERRHGARMVHIDGNADKVDLNLLRGATVNGQVKLADRDERPEQPVLPSEDLIVSIYSPFRTPLGSNRPVPVRAKDGSFKLEGVFPDRYLVYVARGPKNYGVSEVRYNGTPAPHKLISIDPLANQHRIDIALSPATGAMTATVTDGSRPSSGAAILLVPASIDESMQPGLLERVLTTATADRTGRATINGLLPGIYRVIAYPSQALWREDPYLIRRLTNAQEIRISQGVATIGLKVQSIP